MKTRAGKVLFGVLVVGSFRGCAVADESVAWLMWGLVMFAVGVLGLLGCFLGDLLLAILASLEGRG